MAKNSKGLLQSFANRLAEAALSEDGARALRLFQVSGLLDASSNEVRRSQMAAPGPSGTSSPGTPSVDRIGIWERKSGSPHFVRREDKVKEWEFWANMESIGPKSTKKRVVLLGESVARGYFYDPQFTPAIDLESLLQSQLGESEIEVIDLARTDLVANTLKELAVSATLLLEPDAVIIFAGNNWRSSGVRGFLSGEDFPSLDSLLREQGVAGLKQLIEERLVEEARQLIHDVASLYQAKGIPLLWMIPEFNLTDWRDPVENAPYLPGTANLEWLALHEEADAALLARDTAAASVSARKMIELDGGVSVRGFYILAECSHRQGNLTLTRKYLESARDAVIWDSSIGSPSPRPYSVVQTLLREEPVKFGWNQVLDLPTHFENYLKDTLPDRRLFLDYCHMTIEGIHVAMAEAASRLVKVLEGSDLTWQALLPHARSVNDRVAAEAAFLAAIHNAHWYQDQEIVSYHCRSALQLAPEISQVMLDFAHIQSRRHPMYMYEAAQEMAETSWPSIQHYLFQMFFRTQNHQLDKTLINGILEQLQDVVPNSTQELRRTLCEEHSVSMGPVNLLDRFYCSAASQPQEMLWVTPGYSTHKQNDYYRAYSKQSRFCFVSDGHGPILLSLTCRVPEAVEGMIRLEVNGRCQAEFVATNEWSTWDIAVADTGRAHCISEVAIQWPNSKSSESGIFDRALENIRGRLLPEFYRVFGEVHSFVASDARRLSILSPETHKSNEALLFET